MRRQLKTLIIGLSLIPMTSQGIVLEKTERKILDPQDTRSPLDPQNLRLFYNSPSKILQLYQAGKISDAKKLLAERLQKNQRDVGALDVAGTIFLWERRYREAQVSFEAALAAGDRKNASILAKLGVVRIQSGSRDKGLRILRLAYQLDPENLIAQRYLAWHAETSQDYNRAIAHYQHLYNSQPSEKSTYLQALVRVYRESERYPELIALLESDQTRENTDPRVLPKLDEGLLEAYIETRNYPAASQVLKNLKSNSDVNTSSPTLQLLELQLIGFRDGADKAVSFSSKMTMPTDEAKIAEQYLMAKIYASHDQLAAAEKQLRKIADGYSAKGQIGPLGFVLKNLIALLLEQQLNRDAVEAVNAYQQKHPHTPLLQYQLAEVQVATGRKREAISTLLGLTTRNPDFVPAHMLYGRLQREDKRFSEAKNTFLGVIKSYPGQIDAWIQLAGTHSDKQENDLATRVLIDGLQQNPQNLKLMFELAYLFEVQGNGPASAHQYQLIINSHPDFLPALDNLAAYLLYTRADIAHGLSLTRRALELAPQDPSISSLHGYALFLNNKKEEGLKNMLDAATKLQESGLAYYHLGLAYGAENKHKLAQKAFTSALKKGLTPERAKIAKQQLASQ